MTIAGRINAAVALVALLSGAVLSVAWGLQQYRVEKREVLGAVDTAIARQPQLVADIYLNADSQIREHLSSLHSVSSAVRRVALIDGEGQVISQIGVSGIEALPFAELRGEADALEPSRITITGGAPPPESVVYALLTGGERLVVDTRPLFSPLNPRDDGWTREDFGRALADPEAVESQHVIAYLQVSISHSLLLANALPAPGVIIGANLLFAGLCMVLVRLLTGRVTRPLGKLAAVAENLADGTQQQTITIHGSNEIASLAAALNRMIESLSNYKTRTDVDQTLLRMKVDERTAQLSRRNQELNVAVKQVTEAKDRLRHLAYYDSLTALPNRRLFTEQLNLLLRMGRRSNKMLALLFLDLDNFKRINDSLGHAAGDLLLKEVATRLSGCVRESDVVAYFDETDRRLGVSRLGGDEFTVVLNQLDDLAIAGQVAERLLNVMHHPITIDGHEVVVTPSIGIAIAPRDGDNLEALLRAADTAMYQAKRGGKRSYVYYDPEMDAAGVERLQLETDLRKAVEHGELQLHYQPQVDTYSGSVVGVEALLRWPHPERGMIPPYLFVPLAEELGLVGELGRWVLERACSDLKQLQREGYKLAKISVNVSALQFGPDFVSQVTSALKETALSPEALALELTEGIAMENNDVTLRVLHELRETGVRLSIDDFGTGYSSLSYVSRFPLDELKIDRSFVNGVENNPQQAGLVAAIIAMGKSLNLELVAEGVETAAQYHYLTRSGCRVIQGYLFSKPLSLEELKPLLDTGHFARQILDITGVLRVVERPSLPGR